MIYVEVSGLRRKKFKLILKEACYFYLAKLNVTKRTIPVDISIIMCDMAHEGLCDFNHDYQYPEFEISINRDSSDQEMLESLAHEMVHVKQFLKKQIRNVNGVYHWMGQVSMDNEWEKEAYELESILYKEFMNEKFE